jgi:uncharacterized membrane protein
MLAVLAIGHWHSNSQLSLGAVGVEAALFNASNIQYRYSQYIQSSQYLRMANTFNLYIVYIALSVAIGHYLC